MQVAGTPGYIDPEFAATMSYGEWSDIFGLGIAATILSPTLTLLAVLPMCLLSFSRFLFCLFLAHATQMIPTY